MKNPEMPYFESLEAREKEPFDYDLRVSFLRHGESMFSEEDKEKMKMAMPGEKFSPERKLTEKGVTQVKEAAIRLAENIDRAKELVVIWSSPRRRAQETAHIVEEAFKQAEIPIITFKGRKDTDVRIKESLRATDTTRGFMDLIMKESAKDEGKRKTFMELWRELDREGALPPGVESREACKKRFLRVLTTLEKIGRMVRPEANKKLRIVMIGHEETPEGLLVDVFGEQAKMPTYGESFELDIKAAPRGVVGARMRISYEGKEMFFNFDREKRTIALEKPRD